MDLNKELMDWGGRAPVPPREETIRETIGLVQARWLEREKDRAVTGWEFLILQLGYTRKIWWLLQAALLLAAWQLLPAMEHTGYRIRSLGVTGCLFVIFMIPELWRNREWDATQVEAACLYSLKQIYAARLTLFGMVDVFLLTLFCMALGRGGYTLEELVAQLLLPATVTAWICLQMLCARPCWSQAASQTVCLLWCALWWLVLMNEKVYSRMVPSLWSALFALSLVLLALAIRKTIRTTNQYWEVILT